jgi:HEAT repeat protein
MRAGFTDFGMAEPRGLKRNAAVVLGNVRTHEDIEALHQALEDDDALVREHAAWALARLGDFLKGSDR